MWAFHRCLATSAQSLPKGTCAQVSHYNHKIRNKEVLNTAFLIFAKGMCFSYCCYRNWLSISRFLLLIMNKWKDQLKNVKQFFYGRILLLRNMYETSFCNKFILLIINRYYLYRRNIDKFYNRHLPRTFQFI